MQILRTHPDHPLRKRLWQAAAAAGLIMLVLVVHETFVRQTDGSHTLELGQDYLPVYAAGTLVREGHSAELYGMEPMARVERQVVREADLVPLPVYGPFLNPPFFAALYAPLSALPYRESLAAWLGINLLLLGGSIVLLCRMLPADAGWRCWGLIPLLIVLPLPFWEAMCHQQNTFLSLLLLCVVVSLWRADGAGGGSDAGTRRRGDAKTANPRVSASPRLRVWHPFLAGLIAGLLFYKPQLALAVAAVLVLTRGWRALLGLSVTGLVLLIFTLWAMPGTLSAFLHGLPPTVQWMQTVLPYNWGRQVTPQSFWRLLIENHAVGKTHLFPRLLALLTTAAVGLALAAAVFRHVRRRGDAAALDRLIASTIVSMPLLMPYYMDYDLLLLAVPAVLLATDWIRSPATPTRAACRELGRADRLLLWGWAVLFLELYGNPGLGSHTRLNLAVPLIGLIAGLYVARCFRARVATVGAAGYDTPTVAVAA